MKFLRYEPPFQDNLIELSNDTPNIVIGNPLDGHDLLTPFYITLEFEDLHLHNFSMIMEPLIL